MQTLEQFILSHQQSLIGKLIDEKLDYIHNNPLEDEIVKNQEEYLYSSAINYTGGKGIFDVELLV